MSDDNTTPKAASVADAKRKIMRSRVRVYVTYAAGIFVFGGGLFLMAAAGFGWLADKDSNPAFTNAKDIFMMVLPIATGILTYWFAERAATKGNTESDDSSTTP